MPRLGDSKGQYIKNIVEQFSLPSSNSETSIETESSNNHFEPQNMENVGNPPPHDNPPHNNPPHDNPLFANMLLQEYLHPHMIATPSCIMFPPNVQH